MRYRLVSSAIPTFVVLCGMSVGLAGCAKDPNPSDHSAKVEKNVKTKEAVATELAPKGRPAPDLPVQDPAVKESPAADVPAKDLVIQEGPTKVPAQEIAVKEPDAKGLSVDPLETKKDKGITKEAIKDKEPKKDPGKEAKDPKKEVPVPELTEFLGKNFGYWRNQIKDKDPGKREEAMKAVLVFGPKKAYEAVPDILTQLERHLAKKNPENIDLAVRVNGIMALSAIFKYAQPPNPDPKHIERALPIFKASMNDPQVILKVRAVQGLPFLGPASHGLIEDVIKLVNLPITWEVRKEAIQTLAVMASPDGKGPPHPKVMPLLRLHMNPTEESSYSTRSSAVQAIAMLAQEKMPPELYKGLLDPTVQVRLTALQSITTVSVGLDTKKAMKDKDRVAIVEHLETYLAGEKDEILQVWAHASIMTVIKSCKKHLGPVVRTMTITTDPAVKMQALTVISLCEDKGKPIAYDSVLAMIHDENLGLAGAAMATLISMHAFEAIPDLKKIVDDKKEHEVRKDTAEDAILALEYQVKMTREKSEKDKKTPEKK